MEHTIKLEVSSDQVIAHPNPLSDVRSGDTVTFELVGDTAGAEFEVEFHEVRRPCPPQGPFVGKLQGTGPLSGTVPRGPRDRLALGESDRFARGRRDRFIYNVFRVVRRLGPGLPERTRLTWARGMEGGGGNFGGLDVQPPPPPPG